MASKQDYINSLWNDVTKRKPPMAKYEILITVRNRIIVRQAYIARMDADRFLQETNQSNWAWDRVYTHWMKIPLPERR